MNPLKLQPHTPKLTTVDEGLCAQIEALIPPLRRYIPVQELADRAERYCLLPSDPSLQRSEIQRMTIAFTIKFNRQDGTADVDGDTTLLCLLCNVFVNASAKFG
jgi:hypothetical protein